ncbi:MAG: hypothetical protein A6F70_04315 [Cycloclasticus sp. symbiont of Bathymodiolus heckerae]|nr:MAG: hypothetical protein A6F70_04315 [Cycloclasticus sp. symbiont of Bathymodiolus heckerae]
MRSIVFYKLRNLLVSTILLCPFSAAFAVDDIRVGMTGALSGLSATLGQQMKVGLELGFSEVNSSGGINGRKIRLIALDDAYQPLKAAANMRVLIDQEKVLAVLGNTGTPTVMLTVPIANDNKVLMLGAYTGAGVLRDESNCCIYNYRASYKQETALMIRHILSKGIKPNEIAFFTQNDSYGDAGYNGAIEKLKSVGFDEGEQLLHVRYRRNTVNVEQSVANILTADVPPKAIIMVGSYAASSKFITILKAERPNIKFYNISFTGSQPLLDSLGESSEGVFITEVVPSFEIETELIKGYKAALVKEKIMDSNVISLEGYIVAKIFIEILQSIEGDINKQAVLLATSQLERLKLGTAIRGLSFSEGNKQASQTVWLNRIENGQFKQQDVSKQ